MTEEYQGLIINSPYEEPKHHWIYQGQRKSKKVEGRRQSEYIIDNNLEGLKKEIGLVNEIRKRVKNWKQNGRKGISSTTRTLLNHWEARKNSEEGKKFFYCQIEAIETIIFLNEAPPEYLKGLEVPEDEGMKRLCTKMATGTGKTIVMAMLIAYHVLNKINNPTSDKFTKHVLVIAPNLTVKERIEVLRPDHPNNMYDEMNILPTEYKEKINQLKIICHNWHTLNFDTQDEIEAKIKKGTKEVRSVDKRKLKAKSDEAYFRGILQDCYTKTPMLVINDEAHHAWRDNKKTKGIDRQEKEMATKWIKAIDRIKSTGRLLACHDFSATPFKPGGKHNSEEDIFKWIISDFGLTEATETGLVKTPEIPASVSRANFKHKFSDLRHIYAMKGVQENVKSDALVDEPLPEEVIDSYKMLTQHRKEIEEGNEYDVPPVIISVVNNTKTAERIEKLFTVGMADVTFDGINTDDVMKRIDSNVFSEEKAGEKEKELRKIISTVGKRGQPGEQIKNVISVNMLNEGWDAKNVTHIIGLRAFTSELLCEQIVGRGLRRQSYDINEDGMLEPEHVYIVGIPFSFVPYGETTGKEPRKHKPSIEIYPDPEKEIYKIDIPNIKRISATEIHDIDIENTKSVINEPIKHTSKGEIEKIEMGYVIESEVIKGETSSVIENKRKAKYRLQTQIYALAAIAYEKICNRNQNVEADKSKVIGENMIIRIIELIKWMTENNKILINDKAIGDVNVEYESSDDKEGEFKRSENQYEAITVNNQSVIADRIVKYIIESKDKNENRIEVSKDKFNPVISTKDMKSWYTKRPTIECKKSHINRCVIDSMWEKTAAEALDKSSKVIKWVKNEHVGLKIPYVAQGEKHEYLPDFIVEIKNEGDERNVMLILEIKGKRDLLTNIKETQLEQWVDAMNQESPDYIWQSHTLEKEDGVPEVIEKYRNVSE